MNDTIASSWEEFSPWLQMLEDERERLRAGSGMHVSDLLFRGQADATWKLTTTLERSYPSALRVKDYYSAAYAAKHQIEAHLGKSWDIPDTTEFDQWVDTQRMYGTRELPALEYLVYLRHHGFPSPLLDWTQSPYVAAYFALGSASVRTERVAIYAYLEYAGGAKGSSSRTPSIQTVGQYFRTHRRHFLQQSQYSLCTMKDGEHWSYTDHESAFTAIRDEQQDLLWKFTLPLSERLPALKFLDKFNLNAFSLLGSEESLMETVAFRELGMHK
jgi:hypothetical protein